MAIVTINWKPDRKRLRWFGGAAFVVFAVAGGWTFLRHSLAGVAMTPDAANLAAGALGGLAVLCGILAIASPAALKPLFLGLSVIGWPIGWLASHVALALVYYAVLTPIGVAMRLWGRDPLQRRFDRKVTTYWTRRQAPVGSERYFRQF